MDSYCQGRNQWIEVMGLSWQCFVVIFVNGSGVVMKLPSTHLYFCPHIAIIDSYIASELLSAVNGS